MNEYNERLLKNVLEDCREEQTEQLKKEIEEAKNNPLFQNKEGEAEAFVQKHIKKPKKNFGRGFLKVASIVLVIVIGFSFIPFTVEGRRSSVAEIIVNLVNSEFVAFDSNEDDSLLLSYEGKFIPTFIPDGYSVKSVVNGKDKNEIILSDSKNTIIFIEQAVDVKTNIDYANADDVQEIEVLGFNGMYCKNDGIQYITVVAEKINLFISCNDIAVDIIGLAEKIEKR